MPIDIQRFSEYRPPDSITLLGDVKIAKDYQNPFAFSTWLNSFKQFNESPEIYIDLYRKYLSKWYVVKNDIILTNAELIVLSYTSIFYDLQLTYFTSDERRFLTTLDYNKRQDIDIAIPFFARKIKSICKNLVDLRESIKSQPVKLNLGGTRETLSKLIYDSIYASFKDTDLQPLFYKDDISEETILNSTRVLVEELYDDTDYYVLSGYNEQIPIEYQLFLDFSSAILAQLSAVEFIVPELSDYLTFTPNIQSTDLQYLYDKDFINTINNGLSANLNLNNLADLTKKFAGSDFYYLSTNSQTEVVSGILFTTTSKSANDQNIFNLKFALKQLVGDNLYTARDVGGFYLPEKIGILYYNPIKSTYTINQQSLQPNKIVVYPDPNVYPYNGDGVLSFIYNTTVFKHTISDQYIFGDIKDDRNLPDFKGYQSYNQSVNDYFSNISKPTDSVGFFKNSRDNIWLNPDVYPIENSAVFPVSSRQNKLLVNNNTDLIKFRTDVYGNSYGLLKEAFAVENINLNANQLIPIILNYLDGFFFNWTRYSGNDFDYYATSPEIEGYIRSGLSATTFDQISTVGDPYLFSGNAYIPMFALSGDYIYIYGGSFTDLYGNSLPTTIYVGNVIYDGYTFTNQSNGQLFYETPSTDSPSWPGSNSNQLLLYYQYYIEGGANNNNERPTFVVPATFKPAALASTGYSNTENVIDAGQFLYFQIIDNEVVLYNPFADRPNNYYESSIPYYDNVLSGNETIYTANTGLNENLDIYKKRNLTYGSLIVRSGNNTIISPISSALSANFVRYPDEVKTQINNNVIDFDIIYDTIIIETTNYRVVEKINYDYDANIFIGSYTPAIFMTVSGSEQSLAKFGNFWFNEYYKNILFFDTTLSDTVSGNLKIIYPSVYKLDLVNYEFKKIYPLSNEDLTIFSLSSYLSGLYDNTVQYYNFQYIFNPQNVDTPSVAYNYETDIYTVIVKMYDNAGASAIQELQFKFISGIFTLLVNKCYFLNEIIRDESYSNPVTANFLDYLTPVVGLNTGVWDSALGVYKF
jgi:hypothetical protein